MHTGSQVVCVDDTFPAWVSGVYVALPVKGTIYTVRELRPGRGKPLHVVDGRLIPNGAGDNHPEIYILLEELRNPPDPFCAGTELGFKAERFADVEAVADTVEAEHEHIGVG